MDFSTIMYGANFELDTVRGKADPGSRFLNPVYEWWARRFAPLPTLRVTAPAAYLTSSRIARSSPSSVSGYMRWPISWRTILIE